MTTKRSALVAVIVLFISVVTAGPAQAHSAAGSPSSNYRTVIDSITPPSSGFRIKVIEEGSRLQLTWLQGDPIIVPGYQDEPYLRVDQNGVEENLRSAALYVNQDRFGTSELPSIVDEDAAPQWKRSSSERTVRFHYHPAHWMLTELPPVVREDPSKPHDIQSFTLVLQQGNAASTVSGRLLWVPGPSPIPKYAGAALAALLAVVAAVWAGVQPARRRTIRPLIVALLGALVAGDVVHLLGIVGGVQGGSYVGRLFSIGYASMAAWAMAVTSMVLWLRGRDDALYLATFAAGLMTLVGGVADIGILSKSSVVFAWADELARWSVALTLGLGIGMVIAAVLLTRPEQREPMTQ